MFDLATRPQSARDATTLVGVPFDLRLITPLAPAAYPYTDYTGSAGTAQPGVEMLATYALALEDTLQTAIILSLFTDRRAGRDDVLPPRQTDRRGWMGDEFVGADNDAWGSALWLIYTGKAVDDVLDQARFAAKEALAWLVRDGIASQVDVTAEWVGPRADRLAVRPTIYKPGQVSPVYDVLWGTSLVRGMQS